MREPKRPLAFTRQTPPAPTGVYVQLPDSRERVPADLVYAGRWPVPGHKSLHDVWQTREHFKVSPGRQPKLVITESVPALTRIELRLRVP